MSPIRSCSRRALATFVAAVIGVAPAWSAAACEPSADADAPSSDSDADNVIALARAMFDQGAASYEAGDYGQAIRQWTMAHDLMAGVPALVAARHVLAFDLGQAHMRAYDRDSDRSHLTTAQPLLESYVAWVDRPQHTMNAAEREDRSRAVEMLARIAIEVGTGSPAPAPAPSPAPESAPAPKPSDRPLSKGTGLIVGGSGAMGLSAAFAGIAIGMSFRAGRAQRDFVEAASDLERDEANFKGVQANRWLIVSSVSSAALGVAGIGMVAAGAVRRRKWMAAHPVAVHPLVAPTFAGVGLRGNF